MPEQHVDRFRTATARWLLGSFAGCGGGSAGLLRYVAQGFGAARVSNAYRVAEAGEPHGQRAADVASANNSNVHICKKVNAWCAAA
jgi:hypothetical protein